MAGPDKNTRRVDTGGSASESSQSISKTASSAVDGKSLKERDAEWGFEPSKAGMAVEAKMGMAIVMILVCAFGFLVYHKFDLRQRELLQAQLKASGTGPESAATADQSQSFDQSKSESLGDTADLFSRLAQEETPPASSADTFAAVGRADVEPTAFATTQEQAKAPAPAFDMSEPEPQPAFVAAAQSPSKQPIVEETAVDDSFAILTAESAEPTQKASTAHSASPKPTLSPPSVQPLADFMASTDETPQVFNQPVSKPQPFPAFDEPATQPAATDHSSSVTANATVADSSQQTFPPQGLPDGENTLPPAFDVPDMTPQREPETTLVFDDTPPRQLKVTRNDTTQQQGQVLPSVDEPAFADFEATRGSAEFDEASSLTLNDFASDNPASGDGAADLSSSTLIAMLEPTPDVNLFEDAPAEPKSISSPDLKHQQPAQPAAGPTNGPSDSPQLAQDIPRFQRNSAPQDDRVPQPRPLGDAPRTIDPRQESEPQVMDLFLPNENETTIAETRLQPPPIVTLPTTVQGSAAQEQVGVAQFVPGARVQQVDGRVQSDEISEVRTNDTYWTISKRVYGTVRYFSALALYNQHRISDPRKLRPGMKVLVPQPNVLEETYPELFRDYQRKPRQPTGYFLRDDGSPAYRVAARETLSEISQKHLGRASRWIQIYQLNRNILKDPNKLKPGTVIVLPDDATNVHVAP